MAEYISKVIKTKKDHAQALGRVSFLMDKDEPLNPQESAELELLALLIETYEKSMIVSTDPDPIAAILFRMEQQNLSRKNLVPYLGSLSKVSEVLSKKRPLSLSMIKKLHQGLGIPARSLLGSPADMIEAKPIDASKFPFKSDVATLLN